MTNLLHTLQIAEVEMRYAFWNVTNSDNPGRRDVYERIVIAIADMEANSANAVPQDQHQKNLKVRAYLHPTSDDCVTTDPTAYTNPRLLVALSDIRTAAPDVGTSKTILVGRYIRENGLDSQCFTYPDDLPDGQYEMYLRNLTSDCKTCSEQLPRVCQMQASLDDKRDATRYRMARFKGTISDEWQESLDHWISLNAALAAMKEKP